MVPRKLVSFLLPTRGRAKRLMQSLDSLASSCVDLSSYEVLVRADADDDETRNAVLGRHDPNVVLAVGLKGRGYLDLHLMVNQVAAMAVGEFLFLWNDDALMNTQGWDRVLGSHLSDPPRIYHPTSDGTSRNIFPIVRRSVYDVMGRFSESALNDFYVWTLAKRLGINTHIEIDVKHDHPRVGGTTIDQTYLDATAACVHVKHDDRDPRILACLAEDEVKLRQLLSK